MTYLGSEGDTVQYDSGLFYGSYYLKCDLVATSVAKWELFNSSDNSLVDPTYGIQIESDNTLKVETDGNTSTPTFYSITRNNTTVFYGATAGTLAADPTTLDTGVIQVDDVVELYHAPGFSASSVITIRADMLWSTSNPASNSASYHWSGSFSDNPGNDFWRFNVTGFNTDASESIYLYDNPNMTGSPIGTRTFSSSSSSSTQFGLFTPDETKTYYILKTHYQGSAIHTLATKNFATQKKVFCNFW